MDFYGLIRPALFSLDPERAHELAISIASRFPWLASLFNANNLGPPVEMGAVTWRNPVGVAAGFDKNGQCLNFFDQLGVGALEIGTITPRPQEGNARPRLFRYHKQESLRNSLGFNNCGMDVVAARLRAYKGKMPVGVNIGKNKDTPLKDALSDYSQCFSCLEAHSDYIAVNISSPNTKGLRGLQDAGFLRELVDEFQLINGHRPVYIKLSPDLDELQLKGLIETLLDLKVSGVIATNTTINHKRGAGGVSGKDLYLRASAIRTMILEMTRDRSDFELIGVGGFSSANELKDFQREGGRAIQIYSAMIFQGPGIVKKILQEL
jgi:dihydroorotate dehydrogenase